jgi:methylated-DNA-[protein]-cysteine S-methyltransferase
VARRVEYAVDGWGVGELWLEGDVVVWHDLPRPRPWSDTARGDGVAADVVAAIESYFGGDVAALDEISVDLEYESDFHQRCARALRAVPPGQVVTYGELAALAGAPGAARAAGSFCARNRLGLFVPCHRVVGAGGLGSYGSLGLSYKRRLLALEGYAGAR